MVHARVDLVTLVSEVSLYYLETMSTHDSVPLPEIHASPEDFPRAWTRFELVAKAKEWDVAKQLTILPTLLRGKLIDYYIDLPDDIQDDIKKLKAALEQKAGITPDCFSASSAFSRRNQGPDERCGDFTMELVKLFKLAYPTEATTSTVLLQRFVTGLRPSISRHLLLQKRPDDFSQALSDATEIEQTLGLQLTDEDQIDMIHSVGKKPYSEAATPPQTPATLDMSSLLHSLENITLRLERLESQNTPGPQSYRRPYNQPRKASPGFRPRNQSGRVVGPCYKCGRVVMKVGIQEQEQESGTLKFLIKIKKF